MVPAARVVGVCLENMHSIVLQANSPLHSLLCALGAEKDVLGAVQGQATRLLQEDGGQGRKRQDRGTFTLESKSARFC